MKTNILVKSLLFVGMLSLVPVSGLRADDSTSTDSSASSTPSSDSSQSGDSTPPAKKSKKSKGGDVAAQIKKLEDEIASGSLTGSKLTKAQAQLAKLKAKQGGSSSTQ